MVKGSCVCGDWTYQLEGDATAVVVCHCRPCRKTAGVNGSTNSIVSADKFKQLSGTDRHFVRKGDSGKDLKYHNCATCDTIMWVEADAFPGMMIVKSGTFDDQDVLDKVTLVQENYCKDRPAGIAELAGIPHKDVA